MSGAALLLVAVALGAEPEVAPFPKNTQRAPGVSFVQVDWALPASSRSGCPMLVRDDGELWLFCEGKFLFSTSRPHFEIADRPADAAAWFGASLLTLSGDELGALPLLPGAPPSLGHVRSLGKLPLQSPKLAAGEGAVYAFGRAGDRDQVLSLERDGHQLTPRELGFVDGHIAAAAGNGATTLVAVGRRIVAVFAGADSKTEVRILQQHPSEVLTGLAYSSNLGVFYATATSVGFAGLSGIIELLRTPNARLAASKDALYVQLAGNRGVLKLTGLEVLSAFDLARIQSGGAP